MLAKESERCQALSVNSTTDPRSVATGTKQAQACCQINPAFSTPTRGRCLWRQSRLKPAGSKTSACFSRLRLIRPRLRVGGQLWQVGKATQPPTQGRCLRERSRLKPAASNL